MISDAEPTAQPPTEGKPPDRAARNSARRTRAIARLFVVVASAIYKTMRFCFENYDGLLPTEGGAILVTWHGRTLIPANVLRDRGYWALISLSRDGQLQDEVFRRYGFQTIRGSTGRGGVRAALQMARKVREGGILVFTPDGPRGPTHRVQPGVILIAEKSGAPIMPVGISVNRRWLIKSWDSYLVPKPFARAYVIVGSPIYVPPDLDDERRKAFAEQVEATLNRLEREAETRAGHPRWPADWRTE